MGQNDGVFVDFKARCDGQYECVTVQNVKEIMDKVSTTNSLTCHWNTGGVGSYGMTDLHKSVILLS